MDPTRVPTTDSPQRPKVVIIGGGFGGLYAAKALSNAPVTVTLIDRKNHHTFQPLLYQVAMAVLSPGEIAVPILTIFQKKKNVSVMLGTVKDFDLERQCISFENVAATVQYDYLIVGAGAGHAYFGHDEWAALAPGLKT